MSKPLAFPCSAIDPTADAVSIDLTDAGLLAEPWEAIEIDEQAQPQVVAEVAPKAVEPYRSMLARFKLRNGLG